MWLWRCATQLSLVYVGSTRFAWEKDGQVIIPQSLPRLRLDNNGTLHISQTWSGDIGTYTCRVTSVGGNDSRNAHLRVRSEMKPFSHYPLWFYPCSSSSLLIITFWFHLLSVNCVSMGFSIPLSITSPYSLFPPAFSVSFTAFLIRYSGYCLHMFFSLSYCISVSSLSVFSLSFSSSVSVSSSPV